MFLKRKLVKEIKVLLSQIRDNQHTDTAKTTVLLETIEHLREDNKDLMNRFMSKSFEEYGVYKPVKDDGDMPGDMASLLEPEPGDIIEEPDGYKTE